MLSVVILSVVMLSVVMMSVDSKAEAYLDGFS
jgi:hypothetical protein